MLLKYSAAAPKKLNVEDVRDATETAQELLDEVRELKDKTAPLVAPRKPKSRASTL